MKNKKYYIDLRKNNLSEIDKRINSIKNALKFGIIVTCLSAFILILWAVYLLNFAK